MCSTSHLSILSEYHSKTVNCANVLTAYDASIVNV